MGAAFDLPAVVGHRGAAAHAPENTLASIKAAADLGAPWVEFDVKLSADGALVLFHDDDLDRTTDGAGPLVGSTIEELRKLDAGSWFGPAFAGERIPTLGQALALCERLGLGVNLELKPNPGEAIETADAVADLLTKRPFAPPLLLSSFDFGCLLQCRARAPQLSRGFLTEDVPADLEARLEALACATWHVEKDALIAAPRAAARAGGRPIMVYTVNDAEKARAAREAGAQAICSDAPDRLLKAQPEDRRGGGSSGAGWTPALVAR